MVHMLAMTQLVDNHIIQNAFRCQHQQAVEIEITGAGAAAPAPGLIADGNAPVGHPHGLCRPEYPGRNFPARPVCQRPNVRITQGRSLPCLFGSTHLLNRLLNPLLLFFHKAVNFPLGQSAGRSNQQLPLRCNLQAQGFPTAADDGEIMVHCVPTPIR